jgi:hypothetical protein
VQFVRDDRRIVPGSQLRACAIDNLPAQIGIDREFRDRLWSFMNNDQAAVPIGFYRTVTLFRGLQDIDPDLIELAELV